MSLAAPFILAGIGLGGLVAAFWTNPLETDPRALSKRFDEIYDSVKASKATGNVLTVALKDQVMTLLDHAGELKDKAIKDKDPKALLRQLRDASYIKTLYENLLSDRGLAQRVQDSDLRVKSPTDKSPSVTGDPTGVRGKDAIYKWIMGGIKAQLQVQGAR